MNKAFPENLRPEMAPQPVDGMPGVFAYFSFSAVGQTCEAAGLPAAAALLAALLRGEVKAIEEGVSRGLINSDGSRWAAGVDAVPLPTLEIGRILSDALHRRLWGKPLDFIIEGEA
ncbi:hypothetical protein [Mesorhizobium sp. IMUNJ 23232]|uniref:hypothetical protein n=1 Tax=Mesorhizobium sp. IMUNJ 23232 TaxID=3376064 RepID=UPI00378AA5EC